MYKKRKLEDIRLFLLPLNTSKESNPKKTTGTVHIIPREVEKNKLKSFGKLFTKISKLNS
jgi:hypothetical protein